MLVRTRIVKGAAIRQATNKLRLGVGLLRSLAGRGFNGSMIVLSLLLWAFMD
jgi:hypothetical protein